MQSPVGVSSVAFSEEDHDGTLPDRLQDQCRHRSKTIQTPNPMDPEY